MKLKRWTMSMRAKAFLLALVVVVAPHLILVGVILAEAGQGRYHRWRCERVAAELAGRTGGVARPELGRWLDHEARRRGLRLRLLDPGGELLADADHAQEIGALRRVLGDPFYGPPGRPRLSTFDANLGPLQERPEVVGLLAPGTASYCHRSTDGSLRACAGTARSPAGLLVHVQAVGTNTTWPVYLASGGLVKITLGSLVLVLPLAWWMGARLARPVSQLRDQVARRARAGGVPRPDLDVGRRDEVGQLTASFNQLLGALAERNRANEAFLADLCHELKNPIAAVRTTGDLLGGGAEGVAAERAGQLAGILGDAARRLDALVTEFLELARAEGGLPRESRHPVDLAALVGGLVETRRAAETAGPVIEVRAPASGAVVVGVPRRLESVLRNLIDNAVHFAGPGGRVEVSLAAPAAEPGLVELCVSDTGPGIPAADLPRIFERFYTTRRVGGTGLGLALSRAIVEAHGGTVEPRSRPEGGASFVVRLPVGSSG